ncbi:hypothetical protein GBAR_LOCUS4841 [Geodia barretti]|uniref:NIDO domain-containing protein n=1 Tax=Geodia barretti TaxID=519541 RepID=A0AA35R894_GEOBA|nr:hypothetical protein GBAR_LOCUS4841 [Geodia barretti]
MGHRLRLQGGTRRLLAAFLALVATVFVDSSSALSLEFLELGSSSANLTGSLPRGDEVNSDPISLPNGFPFSNETESVVFVNVNGYLSFRTARDYTSPPEDISVYTHIIAPYWNDSDITEQGAVLYEVHTNGSQLDAVNSAISQDVGMAFEGVWLLVVYWNSIPTAADSSKVRSVPV